MDDPLAVTYVDPVHSAGEERFISIELSRLNRILLVSHADRAGKIHIVSARLVTRGNANTTKMKTNDQTPTGQDDDLLPDYKGLLKNGVRGKHAGRLRRKMNLALLASDVAEAFPTDLVVNDVLRSLIANRDKTPSTS